MKKSNSALLQRRNVGPSPEAKRLVNPTECWQRCNGWTLLDREKPERNQATAIFEVRNVAFWL